MSLLKSNAPDLPMFSDFFANDWMKSRLLNNDWWPAVNVADNEDEYIIELAAPGFKKKDFNVSIEQGVLTILAKTEKEEEEKKKNYTRKEFSSKSFSQSLNIPGNVKEDAISADYADGVLTLKMAKLKGDTSQKKSIEVR